MYSPYFTISKACLRFEIQEINQVTQIPVIAGGLIRQSEDIERALAAGAVAVTTSRKELWRMP